MILTFKIPMKFATFCLAAILSGLPQCLCAPAGPSVGGEGGKEPGNACGRGGTSKSRTLGGKYGTQIGGKMAPALVRNATESDIPRSRPSIFGIVQDYSTHCYDSGQTVNPYSVTEILQQCCQAFDTWNLMPMSILFTDVDIGNDVNFRCEITTGMEGYRVSYEDCWSGMEELVTRCQREQGGRVFSMGGKGWFPLGAPTGLGARWDPNGPQG